jgi:hypothetical protein
MTLSPTGFHGSGQQPRKGVTDPFQVFCAHNRREIAELYPDEPVGSITSRLASIWRLLPVDQRLHYAELAWQLDASLCHRVRHSNQKISRTVSPMESRIPLLHIIQRIGCSTIPLEASQKLINLLIHSKQEQVP